MSRVGASTEEANHSGKPIPLDQVPHEGPCKRICDPRVHVVIELDNVFEGLGSKDAQAGPRHSVDVFCSASLLVTQGNRKALLEEPTRIADSQCNDVDELVTMERKNGVDHIAGCPPSVASVGDSRIEGNLLGIGEAVVGNLVLVAELHPQLLGDSCQEALAASRAGGRPAAFNGVERYVLRLGHANELIGGGQQGTTGRDAHKSRYGGATPRHIVGTPRGLHADESSRSGTASLNESREVRARRRCAILRQSQAGTRTWRRKLSAGSGAYVTRESLMPIGWLVKVAVPHWGGVFERPFSPDRSRRGRFPPVVRLQATVAGVNLGTLEILSARDAGRIGALSIRWILPAKMVAMRLFQEAESLAPLAGWKHLEWRMAGEDSASHGLAGSTGFRRLKHEGPEVVLQRSLEG